MKTSLSAQKVIVFALALEIGLMIIQFLYMKLFLPEIVTFSDTFMQNTGFFIFQILGFFTFLLLAQYVFKNSGDFIFRNALLLFFSGAIIEIGFYLFMQASYQGAFLYSVFDRIVALAFGIIISFAAKTRKGEPKEVL